MNRIRWIRGGKFRSENDITERRNEKVILRYKVILKASHIKSEEDKKDDELEISIRDALKEANVEDKTRAM